MVPELNMFTLQHYAGDVIIDQWTAAAGEITGTAVVKPGSLIPLRIEYRAGTGATGIALSISAPGIAKHVVPSSSLYLQISQPMKPFRLS